MSNSATNGAGTSAPGQQVTTPSQQGTASGQQPTAPVQSIAPVVQAITPLVQASGQQAGGQRAGAPGAQARVKLPRTQPMICPHTGTHSFGNFPRIECKGGIVFPAGDIRLLFGRQWGAGYGVAHILAEHSREIGLRSRTVTQHAINTTVAFVASILRPYSKIYSEFDAVNNNNRPIVVRSRTGKVILDYREEAGGYYSVVTAYKNADGIGQQIGRL